MKLFDRILIISAFSAAVAVLSGCLSIDSNARDKSFGKTVIKASGKMASKDYNLKPISSINLSGMQDLVITQGNRQKITVKASANILQYCKITNDNGTLSISLTKEARSISFKDFDMTVYVTVKNIRNIKSTGTGDIKFQNSFKSETLDLALMGTGDINLPDLIAGSLNANISGTGDIHIRGNADNASLSITGTGDLDTNLEGLNKLLASVSGTGDVNAKGTADTAEYYVSGTGEINARHLIAKKVKAVASGTGDITCYASRYFSGNRSGTADITCYGNPKNRDISGKGYSFPH